MMALHPVGDEWIDVCRQFINGVRSVLMSELAEGEYDGHASPDALLTVTVLNKPGQVVLDFSSHPRAADPINRRRLDEVLLQHGQLPFSL
ncbi:MAG: hypothetical protein ACRDV6_09645 [Acidimicrobiales bacterium]